MEESDIHPGMIPLEAHQQPSLKFLNRYVRGLVGMKWHDLGIELLDCNDVVELDTIEAEHPSDLSKCCTKMFSLWLKKQPTASWNQLIEALRQPGIELGTLANRIEQMLLQPKPQASTSQPKVAVKQSDDNQPRQDNESDQMEHTKDSADTITIDFSDCDDIPAAFSLLTAEISKMLKRADFFALRRAIVQHKNVPKGVQFPDDLYQSIRAAKDLDSLLDLLADSKHWSWVDLRLLETLIMSSGINAAKILITKYKEVIFNKKLSDVLDSLKLFMPQQKEDKEAYTTRVGMKIQKEPNEITVGDLSQYAPALETVIMDINSGTCVLEHVTKGCLEIYWLIPAYCRFHAYKSALNNRHKFCEIHLQYLHIEPYPPIYDFFTIQPTMLSTLLQLSKPIVSTPAEVIDHYYYFLVDNLDSNTICQLMLMLELITEKDVIYSARMYNEYQQNSFLLDQLLTSYTSSIVEFCHVLQRMENNQEIGKMLVYAIESISSNGTDIGIDSQSTNVTSHATISEENDIDVSHVHQPEVFLTAKTVHIRFLNLIAETKQMLKSYNPQCLLDALSKLRANTRTVMNPKTIPLLSSDYLEEFKYINSEEILKRSAFLWTWNNNSILRALLEACNCLDGIKMLDEFESHADTNQPMELFPIPHPSAKMAPSLSGAYTVLSIRCEYDQASLQYVRDVGESVIQKFGISQHSLQLLATRVSPLMLYWVIPKSIVPLISKGVKEHLDFLKDKGYSEITVYPNTILFATDDLTHGSFALLGNIPEVYVQICNLKTEVNQLKSSRMQLSNNFERLKDEYCILMKDIEKSTNIKEAESIMGRLEVVLTETESKLMKVLTKAQSNFTSLFMTKSKSDKDEHLTTHPHQHDAKVSDISKRLPTFLSRMLNFKIKLEEMKDCCMKLDFPPGKAKVKELETIADELKSKLEIKLKEIEKLENEKKSVMDRYIQLKAKPNLIEDKTIPQNIENKEFSSFSEALQGGQYHIMWTSYDDLPCKLYNASVAVSSTGDHVYVTADTPDNKHLENIYHYNTNTDNWTVLPRSGHCCGVLHMLDDRLTIFGGENINFYSGNIYYDNISQKVTTYVSEANSWYSYYPDMLNMRFKPGVITYRNYVIVMGGKSDTYTIHDSIEVMDYHDQLLQWNELSLRLPFPMMAVKPTISADNIIIVGYSNVRVRYNRHYQITVDEIISSLDKPLSTGTVSRKWKEYSPATHWRTASIPYSNPPVIVGGGSSDGTIPTSDIMLYDASKKSWRKVDSLTSPRQCVGVALLNNSTIIVIGGNTDVSTVKAAETSSLTTVEIGNIILSN